VYKALGSISSTKWKEEEEIEKEMKEEEKQEE
jgi:hypothetical protein